MDRFAAIEAFVKVAETQSFSKAAARLKSSKSVVSRHVSALETELGVRLIHRTTRALALTEAGQRYFDQASQILADLAMADESVCALQTSPRGKLRINAPMSFGFLHLAPALAEFVARYPEVEVDVAMSDRFVDLVEEGFDVAVRIAALQDSTLIARRIAPVRLVVCGSPEYLTRHGIPRLPEDLMQHECLLNSNLPAAHEWRFTRAGRPPFSVYVSGKIAINNGDALRVAALHGLGLTVLPTFIVGRDLQAGKLVSVLEEFVPQHLALHVVYPQTRHISPKVRAFIDFLAERFGPQPYWDPAQRAVQGVLGQA